MLTSLLRRTAHKRAHARMHATHLLGRLVRVAGVRADAVELQRFRQLHRALLGLAEDEHGRRQAARRHELPHREQLTFLAPHKQQRLRHARRGAPAGGAHGDPASERKCVRGMGAGMGAGRMG